MSNEVKANKNVPLRNPESYLRYPFNTMEVGESFVYQGSNTQTGYTLVHFYNKKYRKRRFVSRSTTDGLRVWRTK